jgi:hypothetical protein
MVEESGAAAYIEDKLCRQRRSISREPGLKEQVFGGFEQRRLTIGGAIRPCSDGAEREG